MQKAAEEIRANGGNVDWLTLEEACVQAYSGHLRDAAAIANRAAQIARQSGQRDRAAQFDAVAAVWAALFEDAPEARRRAAAARQESHVRDVEYAAALASAFSGDTAETEAIASSLAARFPEDTSVRFSYLPALRGLIAISRGAPQKALDDLQAAAPYELGVPLCWYTAFFGQLYPIYVRGEAYLAAHRPLDAAAEFQKVPDHRAIVSFDPMGALAHLQIGRAFAAAGDKAKAKGAYAEFLKLWAQADSALPILQKARSESAQ